MTMTAEQLEELLAMLDNGRALDTGRAMDELFYLAPSLARRVIAAEKLVEAARAVKNSYWNNTDGVIRGMYDLERALAEYEALK